MVDGRRKLMAGSCPPLAEVAHNAGGGEVGRGPRTRRKVSEQRGTISSVIPAEAGIQEYGDVGNGSHPFRSCRARSLIYSMDCS